jgi:hypothetical protein
VRFYQASGAIDSGFLSQGDAIPSALARDAQGRFLVGGNFTTIAGASRNRIVRLTSAGQRDDSFDIGTGFGALVDEILVHPDGSVWVGGDFTTYNGTAVQRLIRLKGNPVTVTDPVEEYLANAGVPEGLRGDLDDADGDGVQNLVEYLYQTGPNNAASSVTPISTTPSQTGSALAGAGATGLDPAKTYRVIQVVVPENLLGTTVEVQAGLTLSDFGTGSAVATEYGSRIDNGSTETRTYYLTPATEDAPSLFTRLGVSR